MRRCMAAVLAAGVLAGGASADIAPRPLPKDEKELKGYREAKLGQGVTGFVFYQQWVYGGKDRAPGEPGVIYEKVELSAKKAVPLQSGGSLYAVREADAKAYKTEKDLNAALVAGKVKTIYTGFGGTYERRVKKADIDADDTTLTYTITAIDEKGKVETTREGKHTDLFDDEGNWKPKREKKPTAEPPLLVAGLAGALAVTLGGLWLVRRRR